MDRSAKVATWIIATGVILAVLYLGRDILATFAMAVFLFLIIEGFATAIGSATKTINLRIARLIAVLLVTGGFVGFIALMANGVGEFGRHAEDYEGKINHLISDAYGVFGMSDSPTLTQLLFNERGEQLFATIANSVSGLSGDLMLILIYVAFLFSAQAGWAHKLDNIFPVPERREQVRTIGNDDFDFSSDHAAQLCLAAGPRCAERTFPVGPDLRAQLYTDRRLDCRRIGASVVRAGAARCSRLGARRRAAGFLRVFGNRLWHRQFLAIFDWQLHPAPDDGRLAEPFRPGCPPRSRHLGCYLGNPGHVPLSAPDGADDDPVRAIRRYKVDRGPPVVRRQPKGEGCAAR
jgi:hypothetical protein